MATLFSKPKMPAPAAPKPLPREDDEATRMAKRREYARIAQSQGRESTRLSPQAGESKLGDYQPETRGASVLGA